MYKVLNQIYLGLNDELETWLYFVTKGDAHKYEAYIYFVEEHSDEDSW